MSDEGKFTKYDRQGGLASDLVGTLCEDSEGTLWIGTGGGGLSRLKQGRFCNLTSREGLPDDVISQLLEDDFGNLWIAQTAAFAACGKMKLTSLQRADWRRSRRFRMADQKAF